jgi:ABC-2 type transport system permease protein
MTAEQRAAHIAEMPFITTGPASSGFVTGFLATARELFDRRQLLDLLVRRELKSRYKDSRLGFIWSFIRPLTLLVIYYVVIGKFLGGAARAPEFAIFIFSGITIWNLYNEIIVAGTGSILSNAALIKKIYLPREIFPLSVVGSALFGFAIQFFVLLAGVLLLRQFPLSWDLLYLPVAVLLVLIYGLALAVLLSAANVFLRDVKYLVEVAMLIFFWASPIVYPWSTVVGLTATMPWVQQIYLLNPMTPIVLAFQRGIWMAGSHPAVINGNVIPATPWPPDLDLRLAIIGLVGLVALWIAQRIFARVQGNFAQEI